MYYKTVYIKTFYDLLSLFNYMTILDEEENNQIDDNIESGTFIRVSKGNENSYK